MESVAIDNRSKHIWFTDFSESITMFPYKNTSNSFLYIYDSFQNFLLYSQQITSFLKAIFTRPKGLKSLLVNKNSRSPCMVSEQVENCSPIILSLN